MANRVDERMARSLQQPRLWVSWHTIPRPMLERRYQCVAEGVLGASNIASLRHEVRHQTPVRFSGDALYGPVGVLLIDSIHPVKPRRMASGASGRTSTAPIDAPGHRAAHSRAASTEGSSRMMNPANCSFVSAYGPSCTRRVSSLRRTVVPVSGTSSALAPT